MKKLTLILLAMACMSLTFANEPQINTSQLKELHKREAKIRTAKSDTCIQANIINKMEVAVQAQKDTVIELKKRNATLVAFKQNVTGGISVADYLTFFFFAFIGLFFRWYFTAKKAIKTNPLTPAKFNIWYWLRDNLEPKLLSGIVTFLVLFISIRFAVNLVGYSASYFYALGVGICFDYFVDLIKNLRPTTKTAVPTEKPV
jgi:hypothetical protein